MRIRRTRIVCTLGPASLQPAVLRRLVSAGMDVARFNFSHGDHDSHRQGVAIVRQVAEAAGRHVAIMGDLQGPKIRTGTWGGGGGVRLSPGRVACLVGSETTAPPDAAGDLHIPVSHVELVQALRTRDRVLLSDGQIELRVRRAAPDLAECVVVRGGELRERQGVSVPGRSLSLPAITAKDRVDMALAAELQMDYLAVSFVRSAADLALCREGLAELGWDVPLVAKLEQREVLDRLDEVLAASDAVMVARGDLGVELPLGQVPAVQKDLIERANRAGVPVITATEMLESMVTANRPTRAEASDVANAIWDGTDAVMLSQETSRGAHPVESVLAMAQICQAAEGHPAYQRARSIGLRTGDVSSAIAHAAAAVAEEVRAAAIIAFTESGRTARRVSKARPTVPVLAASPHPQILRRTALFSGVVPLRVEASHDTDDMVDKATQAAREVGLVRPGQRLAIVAGTPGVAGQTNLLKVVTVR